MRLNRLRGRPKLRGALLAFLVVGAVSSAALATPAASFIGSGIGAVLDDNRTDQLESEAGSATVSINEDAIPFQSGSEAGSGEQDLGVDSPEDVSVPIVVDPGNGSKACITEPTDTADTAGGLCVSDSTGVTIGDITGVTISDITVRTSIDAGDRMTVTWRAAAANGITNTEMRIGGPSGWVTSWCDFVVSATLIGGTSVDGLYEASCAVPDSAVNGSYTLFITAQDRIGNGAPWDSSTQRDFIVNGGSLDSTAPLATDVEATADGGEVTVRWRVSDQSGVQGQSAWLALNVYSFASVEGPYFTYNAATLVQGDAFDGTYEQRIERRSISPNGVYTVWLTVIDTLGNKSFAQTATTVVL